VGILLAGLGPLSVHAGFATPFGGFRIFALGVLLGLPALLFGVAGLIASRGDPDLRSSAWTGTLTGGLLVGFLVMRALSAGGIPRIHDIATDPADPPAFTLAARAPENEAQDMAYPPENAPLQQKAYPTVKPIVLAAPPADAYQRALRVAGELGWKTTFSDPAAGVFEATFTSPTFLFVDDVVVRVRPDAGDPTRSRVDLRSRSRVGQSDLGANAARIRAFAERIQASS
jgi:uncharacterized protein (DUF1499 family)